MFVLPQTPFNPVVTTPTPSLPPTPRQNHYENVCALRRQRSCVSNRSAECLAAILHRRAASVDFPPHSGGERALNRTRSQGFDASTRPHAARVEGDLPSPVRRIREELSSPEEDSPARSTRRIRDLKEFRNLTAAKREATATATAPALLRASDGRRCFSDSDAALPVLDGGDVDVWQNPISAPSPDEEEAEGEDPPAREAAESVHSCEEVVESGWQVTVSGVDACAAPLPPPEEFGGGNPFLMFLCVTLLTQHRHFIIQHKMDHNELAMHFDKMVRKHNVHKVLAQARNMYEAYLKMDFGKSRTKSASTSSTTMNESC